jgi:hypothetical protein
MGIDWWTADPYYSADARRKQDELEALRERVAELENGNNGSKKADGEARTSSRQRQRGGAS